MAFSVAELKELIDHCRTRGVRALEAEGVKLELGPDPERMPARPQAPARRATEVIGQLPSGEVIEVDARLFAHEGS